MTHTECVQASERWLIPKMDVTLPEFFTWNSELADVIGFRNGGESTMIECKVGRGDFLKDKAKMFRRVPSKGMGMYRYYSCPAGLIKPHELPEGWGLIYIYPSGFTKRIVESKRHDRNIKAEHHLLFYYARRAQYAGVHAAVLAVRAGM